MNNKTVEKIEYLVDDTPLDIEKFKREHTKEEIERLFQECFGKKIERDKSEE